MGNCYVSILDKFGLYKHHKVSKEVYEYIIKLEYGIINEQSRENLIKIHPKLKRGETNGTTIKH